MKVILRGGKYDGEEREIERGLSVKFYFDFRGATEDLYDFTEEYDDEGRMIMVPSLKETG